MRKHNVKEINLQIDEVIPFVNSRHSGFIIEWSSNIGFGEYTIYKDSKEESKWYADSETMDANDNKEFITELMNLFIDKLHITY